MHLSLEYLLVVLFVHNLYFRWLEMHLQLWLVIVMRMYVIFGLFAELGASLDKRWSLDLDSAGRRQNWSEVELDLLLVLEYTLLLYLVLIHLEVYWSVRLVHLLTFEWLIFLTAEKVSVFWIFIFYILLEIHLIFFLILFKFLNCLHNLLYILFVNFFDNFFLHNLYYFLTKFFDRFFLLQPIWIFKLITSFLNKIINRKNLT